MPISAGDKIPNTPLTVMQDGKPEAYDLAEVAADKTVVLFAVPGAFTPTCSAAHLPGFVVQADKLKEKGVDVIACVSVNDPFVMDAWGKSQNAENIVMLADGSAEFTKAVDMVFDLSERGMGVRSQRYSMIIKNGEVTHVNLDEPGKFEVSDAETILSQL